MRVQYWPLNFIHSNEWNSLPQCIYSIDNFPVRWTSTLMSLTLSIKTVLLNLVLLWSYLNYIFNLYIQVPNSAGLPLPISFTFICSCQNKLYWAIHLWESHNIWSYVQWINIPIHTISIQKQYFIVVQFYNVCLTWEKLTSINNTNSLPPSDYLSIEF